MPVVVHLLFHSGPVLVGQLPVVMLYFVKTVYKSGNVINDKYNTKALVLLFSPGTRSEKLARNQISFVPPNIKGLHVPNISMETVDDVLTILNYSTDQHSFEK